jgi:hypothetical protein
MLRKRHLGGAVVLASFVAAAPASAYVSVKVTPVHGRTSTTFAIKFKPRVRSGRYRIAGPVPLDRRWCPGVYHGRLLVQRPETVVDYSGRLVTDWVRDRVFARFSFRVLR